jgi:sialidase-1
MKRLIVRYLFIPTLTLLLPASIVWGQKNGIELKVTDFIIPILKGVNDNPVQRINLYTTKTAADFKSVLLEVDAQSAAIIQQINIYSTGSEPLFSKKILAGTTTEVSTRTLISLSGKILPGFNYLWVSLSLKESSPIDKPVTYKIKDILLSDNKSITPPEVSQKKSEWLTGSCLRNPGDDNVHTYRIPGITITDKKTLIAVYDIRYKHSGDLPADIDVGMSRSTDGGRSWEPMKAIMSMGSIGQNSGIGDPAILFDPIKKRIWVAALWSKGNRSIAGSEPGLSPDTTGQFVLAYSDDDGKSWSGPVNITSQVKNPIWHLYFQGPGNGIAMQDGTLVFPSQYWDESKKPGVPHSSIIYSKDHGKTWHSGVGAKFNTTESQVVETNKGVLMINMRDNRGNYRSVATTQDLGKTWLEHPSSYNALPDPVCMASLIKAKTKINHTFREVLFFSNMNSTNARQDLTIKASLDLGLSWHIKNQRLIDERKSFGYSSLVQIDNDTVGLLYEGVRSLNFVRVPIKTIIHSF